MPSKDKCDKVTDTKPNKQKKCIVVAQKSIKYGRKCNKINNTEYMWKNGEVSCVNIVS